jgi:hypothetical protein
MPISLNSEPLTLNEWMRLTRTTNRELSRLTEEVDPDGLGVWDNTIRKARRGENTTIRTARLIVEASKLKPAYVNGVRSYVWWETMHEL